MDLLDLVIKKEAGSQVSLDHLPTSLAVSELPVPQEGNEGIGDFVLSMPDGYAPSLCHLLPMDQILFHAVRFSAPSWQDPNPCIKVLLT